MGRENKVDKIYVLTIALILISAVVHIFKIADIPRGLHVDEAGMAYDAYCISRFGVDRYLNQYPVFFVNFGGGGQSALYTYLASICIKLFGFSVLALRLPAVFFSVVTVFSLCKTAKLSYVGKNDRTLIPLTAALFLIMPYFLMVSRFGLDCNLMLGTSSFAIYMILRAADKNRVIDYIIAGIASGLILYTYSLSYIVVPLFLLVVLVLAIRLKKIDLVRGASFVLPLLIMALPLVLVQYINLNHLDTMHLGKITFVALPNYRSSELHAPNIVTFLESLKAIFLYDWLDYNTVRIFGTIHYISIPFFAIGIFSSIKNIGASFKEKKICSEFPALCWLLIFLVLGSMLGGDGPNANRLNGAFLSVLIFTAIGIRAFLRLFDSSLRKVMATSLTVVYTAFTILFFKYYFVDNADHRYFLFQEPIDDAVAFVIDNDELGNRPVYISHKHQPNIPSYIFYVLATNEDPNDIDLLHGGTGEYGRFVFKECDEIDPEAVYIVFEDNDDFIAELTELGLTNEYEFDGATVLYK